MPKDNYEVFEKYLEKSDFSVLILKLPKNEVEDKLAFLAKEKGQITRSYYEDYIIAISVANINQLLHHINQQINNPPDILEVRKELMSKIIEVNKQLDPDKLILNRNDVVKTKKPGKLGEGEKLLTENKYWDMSYYEDVLQHNDIFDEEQKNLDEESEKPKESKSVVSNEIKHVDDLKYLQVEKWWKRINKYVTIKQFDSKDAESILKQRYFHNRTSFSAFIVSVCIVDFEELFSLLDNMGVPARVAPPILMHELYQLCHSVNSFLTYERAQDLSAETNEEGSKKEKTKSETRKTKDANSMSKYMDKKPQKKFKDVPKEDLLKLADNMKVFLVGQDEAIDTMTNAIQRGSVGLKDPNRPIGSFLFAGQTGVGKTLATKVLADELIRGRDNMITIDCSEYSSDHEYAKLIGAPAGYIGHDTGGVLTNAIANNPFTVVVFDEVEKASYKVHELLLQILEEGRLTDGKGNRVTFKDAIIVMTSNIGVKEVESVGKTIGFGDAAKMTDSKRKHAVKSALKKKFKPEFLNRLDSVVYFKALKKKDYMRIIDIELYKLNDNLRNNDTEYKEIELEFSDKIKNLIYKNGIDEQYGARPLKREIEKLVATPLAQKLISESIDKESTISIGAYRGKASFELKKKVEEVPFYMSEQHEEVKEMTNGMEE